MTHPIRVARLALAVAGPLWLTSATTPAAELFPAPLVADSLMGPGVSLALATARAALIRDVRYELSLDVTHPDTAHGSVVIRFAAERAADVILDFRGPLLGAVRVNDQLLAAPEYNGAHLRLPATVVRAGGNEVTIAFGASIAAAGASIIRYRDPVDDATYLYTLLVPADANQLFPCFDQPDLKARVRLRLVVPDGWTAVANGSRGAPAATGGEGVLTFNETEPISTYLIAFAAGPWATLRSSQSRKPITLYVRASRAREVEADSIILSNDRAATWLERYFDTPFPFGKLDVVLAPAFPFGGMEHPGAIFYNEDRFIFRERPTLPQRLGRTATIYHEVAHQWFGDLVTMRWFDDLWLKEGFSTYMAAKMQADIDPASHAWMSFHLRNKPAAYSVDVTAGTTPVWQRLDNLDQAKSNYGAIVYNKAPSVLKQLNFLVGEDVFRRGLRRFVAAHPYGNATWQELLAAIAAERGAPLDAWGRAYILRAGMPIIAQQLDVAGDTIRRLVLHQQPARPISGAGAWPIRTNVLLWYADGRRDTIPVALNADSIVVREAAGRPAPAFVFANVGDQAYALVLPDARSVDGIEQHLDGVSDPLLRAMLWGALWDLVRDARLAPSRFVAIALRELPAERDEQIAGGVLGRVSRAVRAYLDKSAQAAVIGAVEAALERGAADTSRSYGLRKAHLDALIDVAATPTTLAALDARLDSATAAGEPLRAPTRWAIVTRLLERNAPTADARFAAEQLRDSTSDGRRRAFVAAVARPDARVRADYFRRYFADSTLNEDWATASLGAFNSLDAQPLSLPYLIPSLDSLPFIQRHRRIFFLGSWLGAFLGGQTSPEALRLVEDYLAAHPDLPDDLRRKILQEADELERTVRIRAAAHDTPVGMAPAPRARGRSAAPADAEVGAQAR